MIGNDSSDAKKTIYMNINGYSMVLFLHKSENCIKTITEYVFIIVETCGRHAN